MNICAITAYNQDFAQVAGLTHPVLRDYCNKHGYGYARDCFPTLQSPEIVWHRVDAIRQMLKRHDWVVWMDADALITNPDVKFESLITNDAHMVISRDCNGLNDGIWMVKNSDWSRQILDQIENDRLLYSSPQEAMNFMWQDSTMFRNNITVWPQQRMNAYMMAEYGLSEDQPGQWRSGDFILHLPGIGNDRRVEILTEVTSNQ